MASSHFKRNGWTASLMPGIILPLGDDVDREKFPIVTVSIIATCIAVFLVEFFGVSDINNFIDRYGFAPRNFFSIGLITSMFLHGDIFHIFGNMLFLWIFGDNVEDRFGRIGYLFFYLAADISASILYAIFHAGSAVPCIGASGAISGVMGAYIIFYPNARLKMLVYCHIIEIPASVYLMVWFLMQLAFSMLSAYCGDVSGVAWLSHIGGFAFGMAAAYLVKRIRSEQNINSQADEIIEVKSR